MVKVSVIIPCYKQEKYLRDALESLVGEFKDFEAIVVNDGSPTANSVKLIQDICAEFNHLNIKVLYQENQGVCAARNNAIVQAQGEFILPLDADDVIKNAYLKEASEILDNNSEIGIVYSKAEFFGAKTGSLKLKPASIINMLSQNRIFNSAMFRKADFNKVGGYNCEMVEGCEDWDLWLSLMEVGLKPFRIEKVYYKHRELDNSRTSNALNPKNYFNIRKKIVKNHKNLYLKYNLPVLLPMLARIVKVYAKDKCNYTGI